MSIRADIIVPTYNQTDYTLRCFQSVIRHTKNARLVWLDNGSEKSSRDAVMEEIQRMPEHRIVWSSNNLGFIGANNLALRLIFEVWQTDSPYIVLLNNDVEVVEGWLDGMIEIMEKNPGIHAVGPVTSECDSWQSYLSAGKVAPRFQVPQGFQKGGTDDRAAKLRYVYKGLHAPCMMLAFFCTVFRREVFERIGYLDPAFGIGYGDDDDICKRMRDENMKCALSMGTYVFHNHRTTFKSLYEGEELEKIQESRHKTYEEKHGEKARVT
jgi:GT2 family glycosyltransferase